MTSPMTTHPEPDRQRLAIAILLFSTVLWSISGAVLKVLFEQTHLTATTMAGYRALFAGLALLPLGLWRGGFRLSQLRPLPWLAVAALSFCPMMLTFVSSVGYTTSANAILLMYTAPLWVLLLAPWLTGDHAQRRDLLGGAIGMVGMAAIVLGPALVGQKQTDTEVAGLLLGLASGVCFAAMSLALRRLRQADPVAVTCINNLVTAAALLAIAAMRGKLWCPWWAALTLAGLGAIQIATPYALYCWVLRYMTPQRGTLLSLTEPIMNPIWTWMVVGEVPSWATFLGGAMIIGGLVVMIRGQRPAREAPAGEPALQRSGREKDAPTAA